jgi:hypothetical protein
MSILRAVGAIVLGLGAASCGENEAAVTGGGGTAGHGGTGLTTSTGGSGAGGTGTGGTATGGAPTACGELQAEADVDVDGFVGARFTWNDQRCLPRSALMIRNDQLDPSGHWGGYLREYRYRLADQSERSCVGASDTHPGWGYTVNHFADTSASSRDHAGTWETVFVGRHHAVHQYRWTVPLDGHDVDVLVQWLFATGHDHPVWAITYDASSAPANAITADTRSPYGDLQWDGGAGVDVDGVGWGDHYQLTSLGSPITLQSGWDYSPPNIIPFVRMWSAAADAEMGSVQTQTMAQHDAGGYWFYSSWGQTAPDGPMPEDWNWTYQLNQYELPWGSTSKRLAWGANFGAVGQQSYPAYGDAQMLVGYPYQSYAVHMVLDEHSRDPVLAQVRQVEQLQGVSLSVTQGTLHTEGPAGVGRPDSMLYDPAGYQPATASFELDAAGNQATFALTVASGTIANPLIRLHQYTASVPPSEITANGTPWVADAHYYASLDDDGDVLWLTLVGDFSGTTEIAVQ